MIAENEVWRPVPGWACMASNLGRVRGPSGKVLSPYVQQPSGHLHVLIRGKKLRVHHAVLLAFGHPRPRGQECRHLNGNPADNQLENLKWGTRQENRDDEIDHGTRRRGEQKTGHRLTEGQVAEIKQDTRSARVIAAEHGVSHTTILGIRRGRLWRAAS